MRRSVSAFGSWVGGVTVNRGGTCRGLFNGVMLAGLLAATGCEKLTGASTSAPSSAKPEIASPGLPSRPPVAPTDVLAKVNDNVITTKDVALTLQDLKATAQALGRPWQPLSVEEKPDAYDLHDVLDELVMAELRTQDGLSRGLDRKTDVQARFWQRYRSFFSQEWVNAQLDQVTSEVTEAQVEQYYTNNPWAFREPERLRVRQIVVNAEDQARAALVKLLEGVDFVSVAQQVSIRPETAQGPAVDQWVMRGAEKATFAPNDDRVRSLDPALEQAAFAIDKVGGVSSYVNGPDGNFHVFQLVERKEGRQRPLAEVSDNIRNFLRLQTLSRKGDELKKKAKVEVFQERLANVEQ